MEKLLGKPRLKIIPRELLPEIAALIHPELLRLQAQYNNKKIHAAELAAHYLITFLKAWKPKGWCEGSVKNPDLSGLPESSIIHFIAQNRLRLCSPRINRALVEWYRGRGKYPIVLLVNKVPSAQSLLNYQIKGERVVSLFFEKAMIEKYILDERDAFSFACHDLLHADHFFEDELIKQTQIDFYKLMKKADDEGILKGPLSDPIFKTQWEYLIADMNAHGEHLKLSFLAFLRGYYLRCEGKLEQHQLSEQYQVFYRQMSQQVLEFK